MGITNCGLCIMTDVFRYKSLCYSNFAANECEMSAYRDYGEERQQNQQ